MGVRAGRLLSDVWGRLRGYIRIMRGKWDGVGRMRLGGGEELGIGLVGGGVWRRWREERREKASGNSSV